MLCCSILDLMIVWSTCGNCTHEKGSCLGLEFCERVVSIRMGRALFWMCSLTVRDCYVYWCLFNLVNNLCRELILY